MSADLQKRFRDLARAEGVFVGGKFATQNDLSALFTIRAAFLYLRSGTRLAFVMPLAALSRGQFEPFRAGKFQTLCIAWDAAWTMDETVQPLFPVPSCVVFGRRRAKGVAIPDRVLAHSGVLPMRDAPDEVAVLHLRMTEDAPAPTQGRFVGGSVYREAFRQGATLVPRMLCLVQRRSGGRVGVDPTNPPVESRRSPQEKRPWKDLPGIVNNVEAEFLRPVLLGESIVPYRVFPPFEGVIPVADQGVVLSAEMAADRGYQGIVGWMRKAQGLWMDNSRNEAMTLVDWWNYHKKLSAQSPIAEMRVAYAASGSKPAACIVRDNRAVKEYIL